MEMIHAKWEQYEPDRQYDVVFGINCFYRMEGIEQALLHMNEAARKYAVIGLTSGPERPHLLDFHKGAWGQGEISAARLYSFDQFIV